jgi:hypothetical protein
MLHMEQSTQIRISGAGTELGEPKEPVQAQMRLFVHNYTTFSVRMSGHTGLTRNDRVPGAEGPGNLGQ